MNHASQTIKSPASAFSLPNWLFRAGRASALSACLLASFPQWTSAGEPHPLATQAEGSASVASLVQSLESSDQQIRRQALDELTWMGSDAQSALPQIHGLLENADPVTRANAARAVWEISGDANRAVPTLAELLKADQSNHQELAAYYLGPMGSDASSAIPALKETLASRNESVRIHAAEALAQIDPAATAPVDVLIESMQSSDPAMRSLAAMSFGNVAPIHAKRVVPALMAALVDNDAGVRSSAELSLPTFNLDVSHSSENFPINSPVVPGEQEPVLVKSDVTPTIENTSPFVDPSVESPAETKNLNEAEKIARQLADADPAVRKAGLEKATWLGGDAIQVADAVIALLSDEDLEIRAYAAKTLFEIDPLSALAAINTLKELVDSTQPGIRPLAAFYLGYIGPQAESALPVLKRALASAESSDQLQIAEAVARINPEDPDAVSVLIGGLQDPEHSVRFQAAYALGEVSPVHAERVIPALSVAMGDQSQQVRQAAALALSNFPPPKETTPEQSPFTLEIAKDQPAPQQQPAGIAEITRPALPQQPAGFAEIARAEAPAVKPVQAIAPEPGQTEIMAIAESAPAVIQKKETDLGLGEDFKPIGSLNTSITPKRRDIDGKPLLLPTNYGAKWLKEQGTRFQPTGESRAWTVQPATYAASSFCHQPLYFEEINLERYGHNFGSVMQPFVSAAAFYGRAPLLPYMMAADCPWECQYTLGHYRPGSCAPFRPSRLPYSTSGSLLQAGLITGLAFAIY